MFFISSTYFTLLSLSSLIRKQPTQVLLSSFERPWLRVSLHVSAATHILNPPRRLGNVGVKRLLCVTHGILFLQVTIDFGHLV